MIGSINCIIELIPTEDLTVYQLLMLFRRFMLVWSGSINIHPTKKSFITKRL